MSDGLSKYTEKGKFSRLRRLHIIYGIAGGFFFSTLFDAKIHRLWYGLAAFISCYYIGLEICLLKNFITGNKDYADTSSCVILHTCAAGLVMAALLACVAHYFREEWEWGLNQNADRQEMIDDLKEKTQLKDINKVLLVCYIICNISYFGLLLGHIVIALASVSGPEELKVAKWQIFPSPLAAHIETPMQFVWITIGLYITYPVFMYMALCDALLSIAAAQEYYLSAAILWTSIERFSEESTIAFENLNEKFVGTDHTSYVQDLEYLKLQNMERENLVQKIRSVIRIHQENIRRIRLILPCVQLKFAYKLSCNVVVFLMIIFALYSEFFPLIQKLKAFFIVVIVSVTWYCDCYTGEIFSDLGETLSEKVNNIPWYYLDPVRRKEYFIYVCMAQEPIVISAVGLYQSGMPMYMQVLKMCYSYFNFLRSM